MVSLITLFFYLVVLMLKYAIFPQVSSSLIVDLKKFLQL